MAMIDKSWLDDGKSRKLSRFINTRIGIGEEFTGIYKAVIKAKNKYGNTFHYLFLGESDEGLIFDNNSPRVAAIFSFIPFDSRVRIKRIPMKIGSKFEVTFLNTLEDEEALADTTREYEKSDAGKREENKRDGR